MNTQSITFRRMQTHFIFTLGIASLICGTCCAQTTQENVSPSSVAADRAYEELMSAASYNELEKLAAYWEQDLSDQAKVKLSGSLRYYYLSKFKESQEFLSLQGNELSVKHNLELSTGRAVWALERLFGSDLPSVQSELTDIKKKEIEEAIIKQFNVWARKKVEKRLSEMTKAERLEQARFPKPKIYPEETRIIIDLLADDPEPEIRMEILKSPWLNHAIVQRRLEKEEDPELKAKLEELGPRAFTFGSDCPKPEGW